MKNPPEPLMIFREELKKAKLEKERLKQRYEEKMYELTSEMDILKERLSAQEDMMKRALNHAIDLERKLIDFKAVVSKDDERNHSGYH